MPNEIYRRTHAGLSTLVSSRAADRILDGALRGTGHDPEEIDDQQMTKALLGPVLSELECVLPRSGLRLNLERLARSLPTTRAADEVGAVPEAEAAGKQSEADVPVAPSHSPFIETCTTTEVEQTGTTAEVEKMGTTAEPRPWSVTALEALSARFAAIEHVDLVAVVRKEGEVPICLGGGLDIDGLSRTCRLALTLLSRSGKVRSLHVGHTSGQLFLFPIGPDLLLVRGGVELNLGAVTTAFAALALEEEI